MRDSVSQMGNARSPFHYSVVRKTGGSGYADVALVRFASPHGVLSHLLDHDRRDAFVIHHRSFRPLFDLAALEAYAGQLEQVAAHANQGTLGCFVDISDHTDGIVRVALYERWFDGEHLRCDELAAREFDATEDHAVVDSAEFLAELRSWAEERNEEREANERHARADAITLSQRAMDSADAARQLAQILKTVG